MAKNNTKKKLSVFGKILMIMNILVVFSLLLSYLASYINPEKMWFISLFGLVYPIIVILNLIFVLLWLILRRWYFLLSLITIVIGYNQLGRHMQYHSTSEITEDNYDLKVLSYNVRLFDYYSFIDKDNTKNRNNIFNLIDQEAPDIMCIQEFFTDTTKEFNVLDTLLSFQEAKNCHTYFHASRKKMLKFGIATFSKYPIIGKGKILFKNSMTNYCIYTDIKYHEDTIRVFNVHFQSMHFGKDQYEFINEVKHNNSEGQELKDGSKKLLYKLKIAYIKRASQVRNIAAHIKNSPYPVILCGDFNDTPTSYTYHTLTKTLSDAFVTSGNGFGNTFVGSFFNSLRIDYILYSDELSSKNFKILEEEFSDHHPITTYIKMK